MARHRKLPKDAQAAAVRNMRQSGKTLAEIETDFGSNLDEGIAIVKAEELKPASRGSGPASRSTLERAQF